MQTYALQKFLREKCGADVVIINYRNPFVVLCDIIRFFPITKSFGELLAGITTFNKRLSRYARIKKWCSNKMTLSRKYYTYFSLKMIPPGCTHYIAGGDQIWNTRITLGIDKPYYLGFAEKESVKISYISYAASFGKEHLTAIQQKRIKKYLSDLKNISTRTFVRYAM